MAPMSPRAGDKILTSDRGPRKLPISSPAPGKLDCLPLLKYPKCGPDPVSPPCPECSSGGHGRAGPLLECHPGDICCTCRKWHPEALRTPQAACLPELSFHSPRGDCMHCPHLPSPPALTCQTPEGRAVYVCSCRLSRSGREHVPTRVQRKE